MGQYAGRQPAATLRAAWRTLIQITDAITLYEREIDERFVRASGPGGQNVNKVATAVELRFDVGVSSLPTDVKARLRVLAGSRMTAAGVLVLDSREHRTQGAEPRGRSGTSGRHDSAGRYPAQDAPAHQAGSGREGAAADREEAASRCKGDTGPVARRRRLTPALRSGSLWL